MLKYLFAGLLLCFTAEAQVPIPVTIPDPTTGINAQVSRHGNLYVSERFPDVPPAGTANQYRYFTGYLGDSGLVDPLSGSSADMNQDGSVNARTFYCGSSQDYDIHVTGISLLIADSAIKNSTFTAAGVLTNGWSLEIIENGVTSYIVYSAKTIGQVVKEAGAGRPFGDGQTCFEITQWTETPDEAAIVWIPVGEYLPGGIRIERASQDKIVSRVQDDLTGLTVFHAKVFGYKHYPIGEE